MDKNVIIIGAGASGVAAATRLISNGFKNVTILEAEDRIGGRINTIPFGANVVDMGAQWCLGEKGNVVHELAKGKDLLKRSIDIIGFYTLIRSDGQKIPSDLSTKLVDLAFEIYGDKKFDEEKQRYHGSFGNFFAEKYKEALKDDDYSGVDRELTHETFDLFHRLFATEDASNSWYDLSSYSHFEPCEGDEMLSWKDKGFATVLDLLQNKVPGDNPDEQQQVIDIIPLTNFNKKVCKIAYNRSAGSIKVDCEDGTTFAAEHLICTVSLGVLKKRHFSMFEPLLPLSKINCIDGLAYGTVNKIYLEFDEPFWNDDWGGFTILWRLEQRKQLKNDPNFGEWILGLAGFFTFTSYQKNMLCGWIAGPMAEQMEQVSDADVKAGAEKVLRMFLKEWNIPDAKSMIRSKWHSNPHFNGSYSYHSLKSNALNVTAEELANPIKNSMQKPLIQFAGEATSRNHYACVHGAIESGWREADRLINAYKDVN